ncbi:DNA cross-link repair 1A protein, partial [Perkinsus olseni]
ACKQLMPPKRSASTLEKEKREWAFKVITEIPGQTEAFIVDGFGVPGFCKGTIYCSPITAELVTQVVGVDASRVVKLEMGRPTEIGGVQVTCIDANHCPGAVMFLFCGAGGWLGLHTGDFRASSSLLKTVP